VANEVKLPRLGQGMESGTIVKWLKSEGDQVEKGEPLYELDTDKVTQEVEADFSGVLLRIAVAEGEAPVGKTIALIGEAGEEVAAEAADSADGKAAQAVDEEPQEEGSPGEERTAERERGRAASAQPGDGAAEVRAVRSANGGRIKASPLARRIARERGIELSALTGTGPEGRIVAEDVERAAAAPQPMAVAAAGPTEGVEVEQLSSLRKTIARRMAQAWEAPAFQISMSADMTRAKELRARLVEQLAGSGPKPTFSDVLTKLAALALLRHRAVNALFAGETVEIHPTANIGLAVAIPKGLVVPVIQSCERKSIAEIAAARSALVERAKQGKLEQADLEGGTFTISNLGMYGVESFTAVLNPPQAAILAVGAIEDRPVARDGRIEIRPLMTMTLTCDHRSIDGATAAEFLQTLKTFLEEPGLAL
jgi:pyruvate dehydrogenase E2 component (dihydrolipoamide acetyltransferase)